jgi:hypothetical protein
MKQKLLNYSLNWTAVVFSDALIKNYGIVQLLLI